MSITTKCYLAHRPYVWMIQTAPAERIVTGNRFAGGQQVLPRLEAALCDEMSITPIQNCESLKHRALS